MFDCFWRAFINAHSLQSLRCHVPRTKLKRRDRLLVKGNHWNKYPLRNIDLLLQKDKNYSNQWEYLMFFRSLTIKYHLSGKSVKLTFVMKLKSSFREMPD